MTLERQYWENAQYSRRECDEIIGTPSSVSDKDLEEVVCKAITKAEVDINANNIEDCHRDRKQRPNHNQIWLEEGARS